jgi:hypothetical protein
MTVKNVLGRRPNTGKGSGPPTLTLSMAAFYGERAPGCQPHRLTKPKLSRRSPWVDHLINVLRLAAIEGMIMLCVDV